MKELTDEQKVQEAMKTARFLKDQYKHNLKKQKETYSFLKNQVEQIDLKVKVIQKTLEDLGYD